MKDRKDNTALLLIDIQNDYFPGGRMKLTGAESAARKAANLLLCFRDRQLPVVHIAHEAVQPGAGFFLPGTPGQKIHPLVLPRPEETVITKNYPNSFHKTPLLEVLQARGIRRLIVAGMMTHMCIDATVRAAKEFGFHCILAHDATATRDLSFAGDKCPAGQIQLAFITALSAICDAVLSTGETIEMVTIPSRRPVP